VPICLAGTIFSEKLGPSKKEVIEQITSRLKNQFTVSLLA
jgi:hypothetical protein